MQRTLTTIIIPTLNERDSLPLLFAECKKPAETMQAAGQQLELLIIDDASSDGTADYAEAEAGNWPFTVRVVRRQEKGLATAVLTGFAEARGNQLIVMDADLSHPPALLPDIINALQCDVDLVLPSRYMPGGGAEDWTHWRKCVSRVATSLAIIIGITASDPMSGYFGLQRRVINEVELSPIGYKILLEILVKGKYRATEEIAYVFRNRVRGQSKMTAKVVKQYLFHLWKLWQWKRHHKSSCTKDRSADG